MKKSPFASNSINKVKQRFAEVVSNNCATPNGNLSDGDGYNYYKVRQVYPEFFQNPRACLTSLGSLVKQDRQFLLFMLSYSFGFSKNMMQFIKENNSTVFNNTLNVATLYFQVVGPKNAEPKEVDFTPTPEDLAILTNGTLANVLNYQIEYVSDIITLSMYYDLYRRFQGIVEDCFVENFIGIVSTGKTIMVNKSIEDIIAAIMGNATLNLEPSDSSQKFANINNYANKLHSSFNSLLNIFESNLSNNVTMINQNITNKQFLESVPTNQFIINFTTFKQKLAADVYPNAYEGFKDAIGNANLESTYLYFCMLSVLYGHAVGRFFMQIAVDMENKSSDYFNNDGTLKSVNNTDIEQLLISNFTGTNGIVNVYEKYASNTLQYMNYLNNYLLGLINTNANKSSLLDLLGLPSGATTEQIINTIYIKLIYQVRQLCNTYIVTTEKCTLSNDPIELYDFPYDFTTFFESINNKLVVLRKRISVDIIRGVIAKTVGKRNSTTTIQGMEGFIRISKSRFGAESQLPQQEIEALYAYYLVQLLDKVVNNKTDVSGITTLVSKINSSSSNLNYNTILSSINSAIIATGNTTIPLLTVSSITSPPMSAVAVGDAGRSGRSGSSGTLTNMLMYSVLAIFVLIVLILIFNYLKKKKYL